ncbi:putative iron-regulated membrane protein [Paraburkholderia sp. GAS333]|uniref:PepSY-associated TM helix domain-containing protein n=1 Tax=Paraburkholderia sp. GAS333 TaxID=3156279 RepID=UPI003D19D0C5
MVSRLWRVVSASSRGGLTSRIGVAILGGYALAALSSVATLLLPISRTEAVIAGLLASFIVYAGAVICVFATRKPGHSEKRAGLRQSMANLHTWTGLLAGWLLYAVFLTGTVSFYRDEISVWMRPELASPHANEPVTQSVDRIVAHLAEIAPDSPQWLISVPGKRGNAAHAMWRDASGFVEGTFDPLSGERVSVRDTQGGDFFYSFHFNLYYVPPVVGRWLVGVMAMFMLISIISGVITHKKILADFFTFRSGKGQRSWLDAHNAFSVLALPFHLMITYTGLVTLALLYMPWGMKAAFPTQAARNAAVSQINAFVPPGERSGQHAPLTPIAPLIRAAEARWGIGAVRNITITNPGDRSARVLVARSESGRVSTSPQFLLFDATDGRLLRVQDHVGPAAETRGVLYALHIGRFADLPTRALYFMLGLAGTAMVGTGLVMWTVKRRPRLPNPDRPPFGFRLVEHLNVATIVGLPIAMTAYLYANRLLPESLAQRAEWEIRVFFVVWAATFVYVACRTPARAWAELLTCAAIMFALLPCVDLLTTHGLLFSRLVDGDWLFVCFDLALFALAVLFARLAVRVRRRERAIGSQGRECTR